MAIAKVRLRPGINTQLTKTQNESGYSAGNLMRARDGLMECIGGWVAFFLSTLLTGRVTELHAWADLSENTQLAAGCNLLVLYKAGTANDVTPSGASVSGTAYWSFDNWGEDLIAAIQGSGIWVWQASVGVGTRATPIGGDQPLATNGILVGMPERHLISFGSAPPSSSTIDPMLVAFSDTENYTVWTATAFNAAGTFRIAAGSQIVAWKRASSQILIFTDISLVGMAYVGTPYIYGFTELATGCGIIGPKAAVTIGNVAFWMSASAFWSYNGQATTIPCTVRDLVFGNISKTLAPLVCAALNAQFNEITWYYPSLASTGDNDSYVTFNYVDGTWTCGALARTAWIDASVLGAPIAAAPGALIYQHETGKTAAGAAIPNSLTTGFFDLGDGEDFSFLDQIIMDFADQVGNVLVTVFSQQYPNGPTTTVGPFSVAPNSPFISPRIRGRQIALQFQSTGTGTFWRLGALRTRIAPDGRR